MSEDYLVIRNVEVKNGRTTIKLEPDFWDLLQQICKLERTSLSALVQEIDDIRGQHPRASAIRVYVLKYFSRSVVNIRRERVAVRQTAIENKVAPVRSLVAEENTELA